MSYGRNLRGNGLRKVVTLGLMLLGGVLAGHAEEAGGQVYRLDPEKLRQAIAYSHAAHWLHFGAEIWTVLVLWGLLASGIAAKLAASIERKARRGWLNSAIFSALLITLLFLTVMLPPAAVGHALVVRYGISIEGWVPWLAEASTSLRNFIVGATFLFMLAHYLVVWSPKRYWLWFAGAMIPLTLVGAFVLPTLIDPMYDHYEALAATHPALVTELQRVVARTGTDIPPQRMFLQRAAEKGNGINARVTGIGSTKRIVVWDTTADRLPMDEVLFIFGHESGHYVLNHIAIGMTLGAVGAFAMLFLVSRLAGWMIARYGERWGVASLGSLAGLVVLLLAVVILQYVTAPIPNMISRWEEHQADVYGQEAIHGLVADPQKTAVSAFQHMGEAGLDDPNPNAFVEFWMYDHPSTQRRASFAAHYDPWVPGGKPKFFPH